MPPSGCPVNREMLRRRQHVMAVDQERIALQARDRRDAHARGQKRIFAIGLFGASPTRIARDVEHRRENLAGTGRSRFISRSGKDLVHQFRIPRARQAQRLRKTGAAVLHESVQRFSHEQRRNAEPCLLLQIALHAVAQDGGLARGERQIGVPPARQHCTRRLGRVRPGRIDDLHLGP